MELLEKETPFTTFLGGSGMTEDTKHFGFGKNWERYIQQHYSDERVEISRKHLLDFLKVQNLEGKYFLDIGCGSGLHSFAALKAGATRVISFDYDQNAVNTAARLKEYAGNPPHWSVLQGSILDESLLEKIEPADIVYSWGVLHHTGDMWIAIRNAARLMKKTGSMYIALYTDDPYFGQPKTFWVDVKRRYNHANWFGRKRMEAWYFWTFYLQKKLNGLPGLIRQAREYKKSRGMDMYTDAVDWLGGWPFEFASVEEVSRFGTEKLGLKLINLATGQANAEYLFQN
jgi:2-polyprenyl-6-hydroxyphenyl methylase/3-demethylubiquinone-9 3-methyltransferase